MHPRTAELDALLDRLLARGPRDFERVMPIDARQQKLTERFIVPALPQLEAEFLAIRADLSGAPSFLQLLERTRDRVLRAQAHQDLSFERLVDALQVKRDPATTPIYQVLFSLRREPRGLRTARSTHRHS